MSKSAGSTIVVLPSVTFPVSELVKIAAIQHYEERMLCLLGRLADPHTRVVYLTSLAIDPAIVDYYLSFLDDPGDARKRLTLVSLDDPGVEALTAKLLRRANEVARVGELIAGAPDCYVIPFNVTPLEAELAASIGAPLYGPSPGLVSLGSKSGSRKVARAAGVPVTDGAEDLATIQEVERELARLRQPRAGRARAAVVKLNNGFSGQGNAIVELPSNGRVLDPATVTFASSEETWDTYAAKIASEGAVVEELVRRAGLVSPSVQLHIAPSGEIEILSTHEQILGGADLQVYLGCRFPAAPAYRSEIQADALEVARVLARRGVKGYLGIDFIVVPDPNGAPRDIYLSEINLRIGGTFHPFVMTKFVTGGVYESSSGQLVAGGRPLFYVATDNLKSGAYARLRPRDAIYALESRGLSYDPVIGKGALLHLLGALAGYGKLGTTCVGHSQEEAEALYTRVVAALDEHSLFR